MIRYSKGCFGLYIVFRWRGTSWPHGILPGLFSASIGLVLSLASAEYDELIKDEDRFMDNPYPYQLFAYLVGFILVFRTNFGYNRYWESYDAVQRMGAKWFDAAAMTIIFDAKGDASHPFLESSVPTDDDRDSVAPRAGGAGPEHRDFFCEVVHLFSLLHALALQHLRQDSNLDNIENASEAAQPRLSHLCDAPKLTGSKKNLTNMGVAATAGTHHLELKLKVLGGLLPEERDGLEFDAQGEPLASTARVSMVESWIIRRMTSRQKYETAGDMVKTAPPILSRMVQVVSDGNLGFSQASKAAEIPFPFPYHNVIRIFLWIFCVTCPFVINAKILNVYARFLINTLVVWSYFSLAEASDNLEDPYLPYDPNDLPLESFQHSCNSRLLSMGVIPMPESKRAKKNNHRVI